MAKAKSIQSGWRSERHRLHYRTRDWGFVFAQRLVDELVRRHGMTAGDASNIIDTIGAKAADLLAEGVPVGLPGCPVMYVQRATQPSHHNIATGKCERRSTARLYRHVPEPLRQRIRLEAKDRGTIREQYERERERLYEGRRRRKSTGR
jgi:hypothetical protein